MNFKFKVNDSLWTEFEASSVKDAFEQMSEFNEVFAKEPCGCCKSTEVRHICRAVGEDKFYELKCFPVTI